MWGQGPVWFSACVRRGGWAGLPGLLPCLARSRTRPLPSPGRKWKGGDPSCSQEATLGPSCGGSCGPGGSAVQTGPGGAASCPLRAPLPPGCRQGRLRQPLPVFGEAAGCESSAYVTSQKPPPPASGEDEALAGLQNGCPVRTGHIQVWGGRLDSCCGVETLGDTRPRGLGRAPFWPLLGPCPAWDR